MIASLPQVLNLLEILSVVAVLLYIYFGAKQWPIAWLFGIIASIASAIFFYQNSYFASCGLNIIYAIQGIVGYFNWSLFNTQKKIVIQNGYLRHFISIALITILSIVLFKTSFLKLQYWDILLGLLSIHATNLEIKKDIHCWNYWIIANLGYAMFYCFQSNQPLYIYAALMLFLAVFSYFAKKKWLKLSTKH